MRKKLTEEEKKEKAKLRWQRRYAAMSPEKKKERINGCNARLKAKRASKAIEEGRVPGKNGPKPFTKEEKKAADYANTMRWRNKDIVAFRASDAEKRREKRAQKAIEEGREVGRIGRDRIYTEEEWVLRRRELVKLLRQKNPERFREYARRDYEKHKENKAKYHSTHKDQHAAVGRTRRAKIRGVGGRHTAADVAELLRRQKGKCAWCLLSLGESKYHVDHYLPISKGGSNDKGNLRILHARCNLRKSSKHPVEFAQQNGLLCW